MNRSYPIDGELLKLKNQIEKHAIDYGLDFYDVVFEVCDYDTINILAAQGGFPSRYPHWRFGMDYDQLSKSYQYGLSKIYEMVVNTDPCYAYLLKANHMVDQKIVMAHVYGHADFFKNNYWFSKTDRKMMDVMANHGTKIRRYMDKYGQDKVEEFIDCVLSLENLIDIHYLFIDQKEIDKNRKEQSDSSKDLETKDKRSKALQSYMRDLNRSKNKGLKEVPINDDDRLIEKQYRLPEKDIMLFLMENAPVHEWQADIIGILREEAYYFLPQRMTKIMNEGWAVFWHEKILCEKVIKADELIDFADHHAGVLVMQKQSLNPYKVGFELMKDIKYRWDTGKHGYDYNNCDDMNEKYHWNTNENKGLEKIFEIRKTYNDISFIDEFLTPEFCNSQQLFTHKFNPRTGRNEIDTRDFEAVKQKILGGLTNCGAPLIKIIDANFENRGEILLEHDHSGADLDMNYAKQTMNNIFKIWKRPVNIKTVSEGKESIYKFNGSEFKAL